jgi:hypothetical protein
VRGDLAQRGRAVHLQEGEDGLPLGIHD